MSIEKDLSGFGTRKSPEAVVVPAPAPVRLPDPVDSAPPEIAQIPENTEFLLGIPAAEFNPNERKMIRDVIEEYQEIVKVSPASKIYVEEAARCVVELERYHFKVNQVRKRMKPADAAKNADILIEMDKERQLLIKRYTAALDAIGALPKDTLMQASADDSLSAIHLRYREEIERLKSEGRIPGMLSQEATDLARSVGLDPKRYGRDDVIPEEIREAEIGLIEDE